ncbi:GNAT family N-acetyltransferase [Bacillus testis]|uniref:GNAT family N-acetyltransferase n=1 Tax=Bacillus testis TaxID=1622072 RepID=UPI00067EB730|nr:GNAT family N-acetyltransferase [Bacillus testis]
MHRPVRLIKPDPLLENEYLAYYNEWKAAKETIIPQASATDPSNFFAYIEKVRNAEKGIGIPASWISNSMFWLVDHNETIIGAASIRHRLTPPLLQTGGHIGYGIRPSQRQKGYATELLRLALIQTKVLGIPKVLVTCDSTNIASEKVIRKNGGKEDEDFIEENGNVVKRFWIFQNE